MAGARRAGWRVGSGFLAVVLAQLAWRSTVGAASGPAFVEAAALPARPAAEALRRRQLLQGAAGLFAAAAPTAEARAEEDDGDSFQDMQEFLCKACCERDWCGCDDTRCDCLSSLKKKGYAVPKSAGEAAAAAGKASWPDALAWRSASIPGWSPAAEGSLQVRQSALPEAGMGLFAAAALPKGTVLPPYQGQQLTFAEVGSRLRTPGMSYLWCPIRSGASIKNMSSQELKEGPRAQEPAYCVDAQTQPERNPSRYVNGARSSVQCQAVNLEICELGQVMYFRTTGPVAAGAELVGQYGGVYWKGFKGC